MRNPDYKLYRIMNAAHYARQDMDGLVQEIMTTEGISRPYYA